MRIRFLLLSTLLILPMSSAIAQPVSPTGNSTNQLSGQGQSSPSQFPGQPGRPPAPPWMKELNLTSAQEKQFQTLQTQFDESLKGLHQELMEAERQLQTLFTQNASADELHQQYQRIQALRQKLDKRHFERRLAEREILTAEQRVKLAQWMQQHPPRPPQPPLGSQFPPGNQPPINQTAR